MSYDPFKNWSVPKIRPWAWSLRFYLWSNSYKSVSLASSTHTHTRASTHVQRDRNECTSPDHFFHSFTVSSHMLMPSESNRTPGSTTTIQTTERMSRWSERIRERETERWQKERGGVGAWEYEGIFFFYWHSYKQRPYKLIIPTEYF